MKLFALLTVFTFGVSNAAGEYNVLLTNMVSALELRQGTLEASFTNRLASSLMSATNVLERSNMELVYAIALTDIAEENLDGKKLLPPAKSMCSNLLYSTELPPVDWHRDAAGLILTGIFSFSGRHKDSRRIATNGVFRTSDGFPCSSDRMLWNAIARHLDVEGLSLAEAKRCYAAVACLMDDSHCDVFAYTNGLPEMIVVKIKEIIR